MSNPPIGWRINCRAEGRKDIVSNSKDVAALIIEQVAECGIELVASLPDNWLAEVIRGFEADDLSVVYVEGSDDGVRFRPLAIDKDGEFLDRWPQGFFEERAEELF